MRFWVECVWNMLNLFPFLVAMMVCPEELRDAREDDTIKTIYFSCKTGTPAPWGGSAMSDGSYVEIRGLFQICAKSVSVLTPFFWPPMGKRHMGKST